MTARQTQQAIDAAVGSFVDELLRAGVRQACVCPGSRSTPLAIKLADAQACGQLRLWMHVDERSAAYFGLGLARARRAPVALVATSGTAAANFLPAIVEANLARVPLIVLTADRPHELRDVGAPQTIDQQRLYGPHVKWFIDLPEPELTAEHIRLVRTVASRAVGTAVMPPAGPVHVNWPFREPLIPLPADLPAGAPVGRPDGAPFVSVDATPGPWGARLDDRLALALRHSGRGLIVCGPQDEPMLPAAVVDLAQVTGWPILADGLSGLRCGAHDRDAVIDSYDAFLRDAPTVDRLGAPDVVLRLGAVPTSRPLLQYLGRYQSAPHIVIDSGGWRDPTGLASDVLYGDPVAICTAFTRALVQPLGAADAARTEWRAAWRRVNDVTRSTLEQASELLPDLFEGEAIRQLQAALPAGSTLYVGNSMPVRDLDTFLKSSERPLRTFANRGANGIDGVVSSALGASAGAAARPARTALIIGDLSFYHDLNGLLAARQHALDLLVVLVNNGGGGIFSFLSQADDDVVGPYFETLFGTPTGLDFRAFVEAYGGSFVSATDWTEFGSVIADGVLHGGLQVVEVRTNRARNVEQHHAMWRAVAAALAPTGVGRDVA